MLINYRSMTSTETYIQFILYILFILGIMQFIQFMISLYHKFNKNKPIIISIDGNIGSGKTTFMKILEEKFKDKYYFAKEPVDVWNTIKDDETDENILEKFYKDPKRWGYTFQNLAFITRKQEMDKALASGKRIIFTERSIYTDYNIFCKSLYKSGNISDLEYKCYKLWFDYFKYPDIYHIYINTNVNNCIDRINSRNRKGEHNIPEEYLKNLDHFHNDWLMNNSNVLVFNGNQDFKNNKMISDFMISVILKTFCK